MKTFNPIYFSKIANGLSTLPAAKKLLECFMAMLTDLKPAIQ